MQYSLPARVFFFGSILLKNKNPVNPCDQRDYRAVGNQRSWRGGRRTGESIEKIYIDKSRRSNVHLDLEQ
jgi:hypothetical protein